MEDDMLATPIGKIPPPVLQHNKDIGPVTAPNYDELRNSVTIQRPDDSTLGPGLNTYQQKPLQTIQAPPPPPQPVQQSPFPTYEPHYDYEYPPRYAPSIPPAPKKKRKRPSFFSVDTLKRKDVWISTALVFVFLAYGLPKIRSTFPSLTDPLSGALSMPALASTSALFGLVLTFMNDTF